LSPQRDVTILARRAVSATRPPTCPAAAPPAGSVYRRRQTQTTVTSLTPTLCIGGPVIIRRATGQSELLTTEE